MADGVDTKQRFEITVPSPKARINLGQPETTNGQPTFGYIGLTLQSDVDLFVDVNKDTFQQGSNVLHQAGGNWLQYADGPMFMTTLAAQHLASGEQLTLVAGAPYGNSTGLDHGGRVRHHKYNNLQKHYRVDEVQNGLFEFFYGRLDRRTSGIGSKLAYAIGEFDHAHAKSKAVETDAELKGFRAMVTASETELGLASPDPAWIEEVTSKAANTKGAKSLKYGFSPYFKRFDPYKLTDPASLKDPSPMDGLVTMARNALAYGRRLVDVMRKIGACITDNAVSAQILKLADAMAGFGRTWAAMDRVYERHPFQAVRWVDEYNSGFKARIDATVDQNAGAAKAKILSAPGLLVDEDVLIADGDKMTVTANAGSISVEVIAKHAELQAPGAVATDGWAGSVTIDQNGITKTVTFTATDTVSAASILGKINGGPPTLSPPAELVGTNTDTLKLKSHKKGSAQRVSITGAGAVLTKLGFQLSDLPRFATGETIEGVAAPTFPIDAGTLTLTIGSSNAVSLDFSATSVSSMTALVAAINAVWATGRPAGTSSLVAQDAANRLQLTCPGHALSAIASTRALFEKLGLGASSSGDQTFESPAPTGNNVADLSAVTAEEIVALFSGSSVTATVAGGAVQLESTAAGVGSFVEGSGTLAAKLGLDHRKEITGWAVAKSDFGVINHELQKLPEDARNLTRPITECLEDIEAVLSNLEKTLESLVEAIPYQLIGLDGPPAAIGLIAKDGISLGTPDRIVGAAGGGFVFVADGGTGQRDRGKWIPVLERGINAVLEWKPKLLGGPDAAEITENLGFRVCSDTAVNLTGTTTAELLALGRGKVGNDAMGIGVARVAASRSVEVCGFEKVSIGARAPDKDKAAPNGGRIELLAHDITIGAGDDQMLQNFGVHERASAPTLKNPDNRDRDLALGGRAWDANLKATIPKTKTVTLEATEQTLFRVGEWSVKLHKDDGLVVGWEQSDATYQVRKTAVDDEVQRVTDLQTLKTQARAKNLATILSLRAHRPLTEKQVARIERLERKNERITKRLEKIATQLADLQVKKAAVGATRGEAIVPALKMNDKEIVIGFCKNANGQVEDGPHLKITPEGFWLETGKADKEVSISCADGKSLKVFADTAWQTDKNIEVTPKGKLGLEPKGLMSIKGANVAISPDGNVRIG